MKRLASIIATGFVVTMTVTSQAQSQIEKYAAPEGWTLRQKRTFTPNDGPERIAGEQITYFGADGYSQTRIYHLDAQKQLYPGSSIVHTAQGSFIADPKQRKLFYSGDQPPYFRSDIKVEEIQKAPGYVRDEVVAGWRCALFRFIRPNGYISESYKAYNLGGYSIKQVDRGPRGVVISEPLYIELGPASFALIDYDPIWPVDLSAQERAILSLEKTNPREAARMSKILAELKIRFAERLK